MRTITRSRGLLLGISVAILSVRCVDAPPTEPILTAADEAAFSMHAKGATTERTEFEIPGAVLPPVPAPCLGGGNLLISGPISGWFRVTETPSGRVHITEFLDFSQLTATLGENTWTASPGASEIWSITLGRVGESALRVVHEGRSRFVADGDTPDVIFIHRIHQLLLPSLELQFNRITAEVRCIGRNR